MRYAVSYRDLEKIMEERGVNIDHATLNRRVVKYSPENAKAAQNKKCPTGQSWRMDETYIKVKGLLSVIAMQSPAGQWMDLLLPRNRQ